MEFSRTEGMHGTIKLTPDVTTELYLIGENIFFRSNTSTWLNLAYTQEGKDLSQLFQSALTLAQDRKENMISESAQLEHKEEDKARGCRRFTFSQLNFSGEREAWQICAAQELPVHIIAPTIGGPAEFRYHDFNQPISIKPPLPQLY